MAGMGGGERGRIFEAGVFSQELGRRESVEKQARDPACKGYQHKKPGPQQSPRSSRKGSILQLFNICELDASNRGAPFTSILYVEPTCVRTALTLQ